MHEVVIVSLARTPIGSFGGKLASLTAIELGKTAMQAAMQRAGIDYNAVNEIYMGNVLQANVGQAPARQAALAAGFNPSVVCTTINKVCASGMKSVMLAAQSIRLGDAEVVLAGGMESMSQAPFLLTRQRWGNKYGNIETVDCIVRDALQDLGRPPTWVEYPEEGHGWTKLENKLDFARRLEAFLAEHLH